MGLSVFNTGREETNATFQVLANSQQRYPFPGWPYFFIAQMNNLNQIPKTGEIQWKR